MTSRPEPDSCLELVVLDDVVRFPWHACQVLSGEPGLGIGDIGSGQAETFWKDGAPVPFESASGRLRVWWVPLRADWSERLALVLAAIRGGSRAYFLVDLRPHREADSTYSPGAVVGRIQDEKGRATWFTGKDLTEHVQLVSSYGAGVGRLGLDGHATDLLFPVRSKSPLLFYRISRRYFPTAETPRSDDALHILVTGAGFDFQSPRPREICAFGLPMTRRLIQETGELIRRKNKHFEQQFGVRNDTLDHLITRLRSVDLEKDGLDTSMDKVIEGLRRDANDNPPDGLRAEQWQKRVEYILRSALRSAIARYDFGVTSQSVNAAQTPFVAWLTTNYTRFGERAIALHEEAIHHDTPKRVEWSIVSTVQEAENLSVKLVPIHPDVPQSTMGVAHAYLFKLHGDIGHVNTMAIAGNDKEKGGSAAFYKMYGAAQGFLIERLRMSKADVVWHIVGHGMQDSQLLDSIAKVHREAQRRRHVTFNVANGSATWSKQAVDRLRKALAKTQTKNKNTTFQAHDCGAAQYLWRLQPSSAPARTTGGSR